MLLSEVKSLLPNLDTVSFQLENGTYVPENFHVTEIGIIEKRFIDCGGTLRTERVANFQLWNANDYEHRLKPEKLLNIIKLCEEKLSIDDLNIEVEYQSQTIGKYNLTFNGKNFVLKNKTTACLAQDKCGIPTEKAETVSTQISSCCSPESNCCQ